MIRLAVFGQPVGHSLSPRIHALFGEQAGLDIDYRAIETAPGMLETSLQTFAEAGGLGCNVTLPLKGEAMALARECSDRVYLARAANTLLLEDNGWRAENTDGTGLVSDLRRLGLDPADRDIALLGAGGAAAGVTAALLEARPRKLTIFNRDADKARTLADRHARLGPVSGHPLEDLADAHVDLVLNATSLGHRGGRPPVHAGLFRPGATLYDLNYGPAARPLGDWCDTAGIAFHAGLGMLVGQAAESFHLWTGHHPDVAPVIRTLERATA